MKLRELTEKDITKLDKAVLIDIACGRWQKLRKHGIIFAKEDKGGCENNEI